MPQNFQLAQQASGSVPPPGFGRVWAALGDSITANGGILPGGLRTQPSNGYTTWLSAISNGAIDIQPSGNFGVSGNTTTQILTRVPNVVKYSPDWCIVEAGTNDPGNGLTVATSIANLTAIYKGLINAGIRIVAIPITPRQAPNGYTTAQNQNISYINNFISRFAQTHANFVIADPRFNGFMNPATGGITTGLTPDGLHPNQAGAKVFALTIYNAVKPFISVGDVYPLCLDVNDVFDPIQNFTGNLLANSLFTTATGGSVSSTPAAVFAGPTPISWTGIFSGVAAATYTGTLAMTNVARSDSLPGNLTRLTATSLSNGTTGGTQDHLQMFQQQNLPFSWKPGMVVSGTIEIFVNATAGFNGFDCNLGISDGAGTTSFQTVMGPATNSSAWPQGTYSVVLNVPYLVIGPANGPAQRVIQLFSNVYFDTSTGTGPATATIDIAAPALRILSSPL